MAADRARLASRHAWSGLRRCRPEAGRALSLAGRAERPVKPACQAMHGRMSVNPALSARLPVAANGRQGRDSAGAGARRMALLFHSPDEDAQAWRQALLRRLPELDCPRLARRSAIRRRSRRPWSGARRRACWRSLPNLRLILSLGAGVDAMLADPTLPDLPLCRLVDPSLTRTMSEFVLTLVLKYHRAAGRVRARAAPGALAASRCRRRPRPPRVGILGLGELGSARRPASCAATASRSAAGAGRRRELDGRRQLRRRARSWPRSWPGPPSWSACCR